MSSIAIAYTFISFSYFALSFTIYNADACDRLKIHGLSLLMILIFSLKFPPT